MWSNFYEAGGWGMYPTTVFGFLLIASSVLFLLRPERRFVPLLLTLGMVTLGSGLLSCTIGVVTTFHYLHQVEPAKQLPIGAAGVAESLHNLVLALILINFTGIIGAVGAFRASQRAAAGAGNQ